MNDLFYGRYFVKETKAPDGFVLDTDVYEVVIDTDGKTYDVENKAGVGFINEVMRGNLKIVKTSSDGKVKGFAFRITGANGYEIILETDENGEIFIEGLRIGDYTVSEMNNSASSMYVLPDDKRQQLRVVPLLLWRCTMWCVKRPILENPIIYRLYSRLWDCPRWELLRVVFSDLKIKRKKRVINGT